MAGEGHGDVHFVVEDFQRAGDTCFAVGAEAVDVGAADEYAACTQCQGAQDVLAAADAAVHPHFDIVSDGGNDTGQGADGGGGAVELAAAVVGYHDGGRAAFHGGFGVFRLHNAFDDEFAAPFVFDAGHVVPAQAGVELFGRPGGEGAHVAHAFNVAFDVAEAAPLGVEHAQAPFGLGGEVEQVHQGGLGRGGEAVFDVFMALAEHLQIGGEHEGGALGGFGAADEVAHEFAVAHHIKLKPEGIGAVGGHVFDGADAHGGEDIGHAEFGGGAGGEDFAVGMLHAGEADGGEGERHFHGLPDHFALEAAVLHIHQHALAEQDGLEIGFVGAVGGFAPRAGVGVVVEHFGHFAPGNTLKVGDAGDFTEMGSHGDAFCLWE